MARRRRRKLSLLLATMTGGCGKWEERSVGQDMDKGGERGSYSIYSRGWVLREAA